MFSLYSMKLVCSRKSHFLVTDLFLFSAGTLKKPRKMQAPAGLQSDVIIELPAEDVEKASGISIDICKDKLMYL